MNREDNNQQQQQPQQEEQVLDLEDETPLAPTCDLNGDGTCEACQ